MVTDTGKGSNNKWQSLLQLGRVMPLESMMIVLGIDHEMKEEVDVLLVTRHGNPLINSVIPGEILRQKNRRIKAVHAICQVVVMFTIRSSHEHPWKRKKRVGLSQLCLCSVPNHPEIQIENKERKKREFCAYTPGTTIPSGNI